MRLLDYKNSRSKPGSFYQFQAVDDFLQGVTVPSVQMIIQHQKEIFKLQRGVYGPQKTNHLLTQLNNDLKGISTANFHKQSDEIITKIEHFVDILNQKDQVSMMTRSEELGYKVLDLNSLIAEIRLFFNQLADYKNMSEVNYAIDVINRKLAKLEEYVKSQSNDKNILPPKDSFIGRVTWCEYAIKGQYLESRGEEFFVERLPRNMKVLNTGFLRGYYDISGKFQSGGKMKEDLMIFNNSNFQIEFTIGENSTKHKMTLEEFINFINSRSGKESIQLTQEGYESMQQNLIGAVQAKATRSDRIKFGNINIRTASLEIEGRALMALKGVYEKAKIIKNENDHYNLLFNYNLAKNLNYILGINNNLLLTRNGIVDLYSYIMSLFDKDKYFYATDGVKLSSNRANKIAIDFI